jgi:hypothetical protein
MPEKIFCNACASPMSKIVYGYPTDTLRDMAKKEKWILGGCLISPISFYCRDCEVTWSEDLGYDPNTAV